MNTLFLDTEFTGLQQKTSLVSIALYDDQDNYFYAELNDFDKSQVFAWLTEHVIEKLKFNDVDNVLSMDKRKYNMKGNKFEVKEQLSAWLRYYPIAEIWADVLAYDWVLFCELFGGARNLPENIFYAPFDLATLFRIKDLIQPLNKYEKDIDRFDYAGFNNTNQHNALEDARIEKLCFLKLLRL